MATVEEAAFARVAKLAPKGNWGHWARTVRALLRCKRPRLDRFVDSPPDELDEEAVQQDEDARHTLILYVGADLSHHVANAATTHAAWQALEQQLNEARRVRETVLAAEVSKLAQSANESIADYLSRAQQCMVEAQEIESATQAQLLRSNVVTGLQGQYKSAFGAELIRILEEGHRDDAEFADIREQFQTIVSRIRSMAALLLPNGVASSTTKDAEDDHRVVAFQAAAAPFKPQNPETTQKLNQQPIRDPRARRDTRKCNFCGATGHIRRNCDAWKQWLEARQQAQQSIVQGALPQQPPYNRQQQHHIQMPQVYQADGNGATSQRQQQATALLKQLSQFLLDPTPDPTVSPEFPGPGNARMYSTQAVITASRSGQQPGHLWLDGGSTHHVVRNKAFLFDCTGSHVSSVLVAGGEQHDVRCEGKMWLITAQDPVILNKVLFVPTFDVNLCSEGKLADKGLCIMKDKHTAKIYDATSHQIVLTGTRCNDLYQLECTIKEHKPMALATCSSNSTLDAQPSVSLFHRRLGHASMRATKDLLLSNAVMGVDHASTIANLGPIGACLVCQQGKATRASFPASSTRARFPCALIHSDLVGPFAETSLGGAQYVVTFLDDCSGYGEAIPIQKKTDVFDELCQVFARWQRQSGFLIKRLRSDRGTEYKGKVAAFLRSEGILHETSTAYTPEQNGRAERFNRTILERVRCMLAEFKLPPLLWGEAVMYAAYCRNYMPMQGEQVTPIELMFGLKPSVAHLRVFGCHAVRTVPIHQRAKTDCAGEQCMFVGCADNSKAWRVLRAASKNKYEVVESVHCLFNEEKSGFPPLLSEDTTAVVAEPLINEDYQLFRTDDVQLGEDTEMQQLTTSEGNMPEDGGASSTMNATQEADVAENSDNDSDYGEQNARRSTRANRGLPPARLVFTVRDGSLIAVQQQPGRVFAVRQGSYDEPTSLTQALKRDDAGEWIEAVNNEFASLLKMGVYEECSLPIGRKAISSKLVLKIKRNEHGAIDKYKARLVARGFLQESGSDFYEVFAPTAQSASFRALMFHAVTGSRHSVLHQLDVSTAFLHADLDEEVYLQLPTQFANEKVWRLKKALYGLRQAAHAWYKTLHAALIRLGFTAHSADPCLFYRDASSGRVFMLFHVDDALVAGCDLSIVETAKKDISEVFQITDMGAARFFLGIEIIQSPSGIHLNQEAYCNALLDKHGMYDSKSKRTPFSLGTTLVKEGDPLSEQDHATYRSIVGGLLYLSVNTRPDIAFSVGALARYMSAPTEQHMAAAKHVLRYLSGTRTHGLLFPISGEDSVREGPIPEIPANQVRQYYDIRLYADADFANSPDTRKSVTGVFICEHNCPITWSSKLQSLVTTSTTEAELVAAATGVKEGLWVLKLIREMRGEPALCDLTLYCDNEAAISITKNPTAGVQGRSKHIDVQFRFVRERYQKKHIQVEFVSSTEQLADIFTKQLPTAVFQRLVAEIGVVPAPE
jgi:transposase InsO family protein